MTKINAEMFSKLNESMKLGSLPIKTVTSSYLRMGTSALKACSS